MALQHIQSSDQIATVVRQVCADVLRIPSERIVSSARFVEDLEADSLFLVELALGVEDQLEIDVPDSSLPEVKTVQDLIDHVVALVGASPCPGV